MKQLQNLTKKLKEKTILTHSYPMPRPTNATELTKKLPDDSPDEVPIPDIGKDLQEELTKLGLNITPLTNTNSATNKGHLEDRHQCKLSVSPSSTSAQPESTAMISTQKATCENKGMEQSNPANKYEDTKQVTSQKSSQPQEVQKSQVSKLSNSTQSKTGATEKVVQVHAKHALRGHSNESPSEDFLDSHTPMKPLKLSHDDHIEAYPWAHQASENLFKKTPLAGEEEVEFMNIAYRSLGQYLTIAQREQMRQLIELPYITMVKIDKNMGIKKEDNKKIFFCKVCDSAKAFQHQRRSNCTHHVRMHLGYSLYQCSFCNFISNNSSSIYTHYITRHGIPKAWIQ